MRPTKQSSLLLFAAAAASVQAGVQMHGPRRLASNAHSKGIKKRAFTGKGSFYNTETGNEGACGGFLSNSGWTVALNTEQWDGGSHCGQQVTISWGGTTQVATVRDQCPGCGWGGLDLTPSLFSAFADQSVGIIQVSWYFGSGGGGNDAPSSSSSKYTPPYTSPYTPPAPAYTPPPPPPSSKYTPPYTPPTTSHKASSTPEWTPPSSSWQAPSSSSSLWTPSSSHTQSSSSSSSLASSSSTTRSTSSSSVSNSTMSSSHNATANAFAPTASANLTTTTIALGNGTSTTATLYEGPDGAVHTQAASAPYVGAGSLHNINQVVLQMAGLIVTSADQAA